MPQFCSPVGGLTGEGKQRPQEERGERGEGEAVGVGIGLDWVVALFDEIRGRELWGANGVIKGGIGG